MKSEGGFSFAIASQPLLKNYWTLGWDQDRGAGRPAWKLQKEGYIRYCEINSFSKNKKNFIKIHLADSLKTSNLKITSSTRFKTFLKSSNNKFFEQNLGLIIKANSRLSNSNEKHFGQIWLTLK